MSNQISALIGKVIGHTKASPEVQKQIAEDFTAEFEKWFMSAENQDTMTKVEKSIVKTAFAWLIDQLST